MKPTPTTVRPPLTAFTPPGASPSQLRAIEAPIGPVLLLAGPGAGKTHCLIERIRYVIELGGLEPGRICAFTFTNKAASEISHRLEGRLGLAASRIVRGTIHAFCARLLREFAPVVGLRPGFGIADESYQRAVLRRLEGPKPWHGATLRRFSAHRCRGDALRPNDVVLFAKFEKFLADRNVVDFDTLILKAGALLATSEEGAAIRRRFDMVLVDETQDLNPVQYQILRSLGREHRNVFAVGDDEQSIYSWAGADPAIFRSFVNDFGVIEIIHLEENRRCPKNVFAIARTLLSANTRLFGTRVEQHAERESPYPVSVVEFGDDQVETAWLIEHLQRDRRDAPHPWGEVAILYRRHELGAHLEAALLNAGIPCRLAQGRALADDPVVAYVIAALRMIASPHDDLLRDEFLRTILPRELFDVARARAEAARQDLSGYLRYLATRFKRSDERSRQIRRALADLENLVALGHTHDRLLPLVEDLLSRRVGPVTSPLAERHDELTDPAENPDVVALAERLRAARAEGASLWLPRLGGVAIGLKGILGAVGFPHVRLGGDPLPNEVRIMGDEVPSLGIALGLFKAAQLAEGSEDDAAFRDFTAVDLETTSADSERAEIIEIAATRVRDGQIVKTFEALVRPTGPIPAAATDVHGIRDSDVATAATFAEIWPDFERFCGGDVIVAHNGYDFDFPVLQRMTAALGKPFNLCTYDTLPLARSLFPTSRRLPDLARQFGIDPGQSHRALDDTKALAQVTLELEKVKAARARKTSLASALDHLGLALALSDPGKLGPEASMLREICRVYSLGRWSACLELYEREQGDDLTIPTVDEVIQRLGGAELMHRLRVQRDADDRYPESMSRLRRLLHAIPEAPLGTQITTFLERALLSKYDGHSPDRSSVSLLTLHSTKGLEFSRVYIVGLEDAEFPGGLGRPTPPAKEEVEEARRLLYVGMTRTIQRLVMTRCVTRGGRPTGGHQFLDEMALAPERVAVDANAPKVAVPDAP